MTQRVVVIGSGMGGLAAAIRLARRGREVTVLEAREQPGGLASWIEVEGFQFDAGPYVLLDRPGLDWAFQQLDLQLADEVSLARIDEVYQVESGRERAVRIFDSLARTADEMEATWPGSGPRYRRFIARGRATYARLRPLQWVSRPNFATLLHTGAWRELPFMFRSLQSVLSASGLPQPVLQALGIWTHVAGQTWRHAPSPLAMVPALIHSDGAYLPADGIGAIPAKLFEIALASGVDFQFATPARQIRCRSDTAVGVETEDGRFHPADAIVSNVGLATYLKLLSDQSTSSLPLRWRDWLKRLPLQSPGVCAYLAVKGAIEPPYLRFHLHDEPDGCRLLVLPSVIQSQLAQGGWHPARLIAPMRHERAQTGGLNAQRNFLARMLDEPWWRRTFDDVRVLQTRIPAEWGRGFTLFEDSMNPVMTAQFMRAGRLAHRSPWLRRLYLAGSATHPGQWVSFCTVSGILSANCALEDLGQSRGQS